MSITTTTVVEKNKRFMLCGGVGAGKTTLLSALRQETVTSIRKTQSVEFSDWCIDTPGEFSEMWFMRQRLVSVAGNVELILVAHDATRYHSRFPPFYFRMFCNKPVYGVVTKMDAPDANPERATMLLRQSGVTGKIFYVSAITGSGLDELRQNLLTYSSNRKE